MLYTIVYLICVNIPVGCLPICVTLLDILIKYPGSFTSKLCGYTGKPCPGTIDLRVFLLTYITYKILIHHSMLIQGKNARLITWKSLDKTAHATRYFVKFFLVIWCVENVFEVDSKWGFRELFIIGQSG